MGGTPLPPFTDKFFSEKGVTDLGGNPPSFMDKIRKVVFELLPKTIPENIDRAILKILISIYMKFLRNIDIDKMFLRNIDNEILKIGC